MTPWLEDPDVTLYHGDCLEVLRQLPDRSVHMCATSPPFYGLRDYGTGEWEGGEAECDHIKGKLRNDDGRLSNDTRPGINPAPMVGDVQYGACCGKCGARRVDQQIGLEETPDQWVERLVAVFREVRRVLRDDGTLWVEIGDSFNSGTSARRKVSDVHDSRSQYAEDSGAERINAPGMKTKDLLGQPWLLAFALRADGWYLRSEIIWARPNPMPESVTDRPTKSHSTVFLLSKRPRYFYDADAIREPHTDSNTSRLAALHKNGEAWTEAVPAAADPTSPYYNQRAVRGTPGVGTQFSGFNASGANARSVWQIPTEPTPYAHFATWPQALVRRMILAGTSESGCCPECGAPWVRETSVEYIPDPTQRRLNNQAAENRAQASNTDGIRPNPAAMTHGRAYKQSTTTGWSPSCAHDHQPVPCTVLDPFAGSGTTSLVARNHGRHSIGIELNHAYLEIAAKRLQQLSLLA